MLRYLIALAISAVLLSRSATAQQAPPDIYADPQNLKVLSEDTDSKTLSRTMRGFAMGLGVRCETCHVGEAGEPLTTFDFAADEKPMKLKAREMMKMVMAINREHVPRLNDVEKADRVAVRCVTCHRGQSKPLLIEDVLDAEIADNGQDAAVAKYQELRDKHYGSHTFDFSEFTLPMYAQGLAAKDQAPAAIALVEVNVGNFPESYYTRFVLAELHSLAGNVPAAIEQYEKAIALNPRAAGFLQQKIDALTGAGASAP